MPRRILIVDDNAGVRHLVRAHLECRRGFAVCDEPADGIEALERVRARKPDLIVLDVSMPRMNGLEVAAALKDTSQQIPIILFTSYADALTEHQVESLGISSLISKVCPIEFLLKEVYRLVGAQSSAVKRRPPLAH